MSSQSETQILSEALRRLKIADHLIYMTLPLVKDKRIFTTILTELGASLENIIVYTLIYYNKSISDNSLENFNKFLEINKKMDLLNDEDLKSLKAIHELNYLHKKSSVEIFNKNKIIILSDQLKSKTLSLEHIKKYYQSLKRFYIIIAKTSNILPQSVTKNQ